jgi:hypothetical protein
MFWGRGWGRVGLYEREGRYRLNKRTILYILDGGGGAGRFQMG